MDNKWELEKILHLLDEKLSLSRVNGYLCNFVTVVSAGTFSFPLFVIPAVTAPSMHLYFTIGMAFMITLVEALYANDGVVLVLALQTSESIALDCQNFSTHSTAGYLFPVTKIVVY